MSTPVTVFRLLLVGVFALAGVTKLADLSGSRRAVEGFDVPPRLAAIVGTVLPLAELAIAAALLPAASARWGAVAALMLLALFAVAISRAMIRGRTPDCHCFGALHSRPVGSATLARALGLGALAAVVVAEGAQHSAVAWVGRLHDSGAVAAGGGLVAAVLVVAAGWLTVELLRSHGRLLERVDALEAALRGVGVVAPAPSSNNTPGLPVGAPAPEFELADLDGRRVALGTLQSAGRPLLLVFTDPGCGPCRVVLPEVAVWERQYEDELKVVVVAEGQPEAMRAKRDELELGTVLMQAEREVAEAYRAYGTPSGVLVSPDGRIASPLASGPAAIKELVEGAPPPRLTIQQAQPAGLAAGSDAPDFDLPLADEGRLSLTDLRGRRTLLLFWNPACGFCQGMTPELERWLRDPPPGAPEIVLISRGSAEEHGSLNARVAVDDSFAVGSAYGVRGTPMAVMVSEDGKVASPVLAGQTAIMRALEVHEQVSHV